MKFRVTVDYDDQRVRTYLVHAKNLKEAEMIVHSIVDNVLTVVASDDAETLSRDEYDDVLGSPDAHDAIRLALEIAMQSPEVTDTEMMAMADELRRLDRTISSS